MPTDAADLIVIGGGVMGLFTAYHASERGERVTVLERGRIGDPLTASFGRTRSFRNDYLEATYTRFAYEAFRLWGEFEARTGTRALIRCGGMNIAKREVTPDLASTYAQRSHEVLARLGLQTESLDRDALTARFPFLDADIGRLEPDAAGVVDLRAVTAALTRVLGERGVTVVEGADTGHDRARRRPHPRRRARRARARRDRGPRDQRRPGASSPATRSRCRSRRTARARRSTSRRPPRPASSFTSEAMPVIAYLDTGIYCHPIVEGVVDEMKIGYYNPPDMPRGETSVDSIASFIDQCMPGLRDAASRDVEDVDQCEYDLVADDDFVLGAVPGVANAFVGVGWRGTGYKFAPWVGRVLAELALQDGTVYDIDRFDPARFR